MVASGSSKGNGFLSPSSARLLCGFPTSSSSLLAEQNIVVPNLGDSITEGTIVEWTVQIGQAIQPGDVVALIETDKVTVDLKADEAGVVMKQFAQLDDTVEVGSNLYSIDAEATPTVEGGAAPQEAPAAAVETVVAPPAPVAAATPVAAAPPAPVSSHGRVPSIRFLGKSGWEARKLGISLSIPGLTAEPLDVDLNFDPMYGRPAISEDEMEALMSGGASFSPNVIKVSSGAEFA